MSALERWINPVYLDPHRVQDIRQAVLAKPDIKYTVLDGFFNEQPLQELIRAHHQLQFSEEADRRGKGGEWLPYDGAVQFARPQSVGGDLFFDQEWHEYCAYLVDATLQQPSNTDVKLRYHRPDADGFWIHTDGGIRQIVAITYFNRGWRVEDGGLLQLWRQEPLSHQPSITVQSPTGRMEFLAQHRRIRTATPGGGFRDGASQAEFTLLDQVVPCYNRLFLCNFQSNPAYHSITPSTGRERFGVVQWIGV